MYDLSDSYSEFPWLRDGQQLPLKLWFPKLSGLNSGPTFREVNRYETNMKNKNPERNPYFGKSCYFSVDYMGIMQKRKG